jgi:hypothetical protein
LQGSLQLFVTVARQLADVSKVDEILADVARVQQPWPQHRGSQDGSVARSSTDLLRTVATPQQLASTAGQLETEFPMVAQVLRRAAELPE